MFNKNIKVLRVKNPVLAQKLANIPLEKAKENIEVFEAESKNLIISYQGLALDDIYDPMRVAKTAWNTNVKQELKIHDMVLVYGLGLGYFFKRAYVSCNSRIILFEPVIEILRYVLEYVDFSNEISDDRVFVTTEKSEVFKYLNEKYLSEDNLVFLYPKAYSQLLTNEMAEFTGELVEVCNMKKSDVNTIMNLAKQWTTHSIMNITNMQDSRPVCWLKNNYKDKTAIILAAGPSLKDDIEVIKQNRDKFVIFAVNQALKFIYQNDISPDFTMFSDVVPIQQTIQGIENKISQSTIIADTRANSSVYSIFKDSKILNYYSENDLISNYFAQETDGEIQTLPTGGTSVIEAFYAAKILGFSEIIFSGLDLAFKDDVMYAGGAKAEYDENNKLIHGETRTKRKNIVQVKNFKGEMINTRDDYALFVRQMDEIFAAETDCKLYNATSFGALIQGMEYKPLIELVQNLFSQAVNVDKDISEFFESTKARWNIVYNKVISLLASENEIFKITKSKSDILLEKDTGILKRLIENRDSVDNSEMQQLGDEFSMFLNDVIRDSFLAQYFQSEFLKLVNMAPNISDNGTEAFVEFKNFEIKLLDDVSKICNEWNTFLEESLGK